MPDNSSEWFNDWFNSPYYHLLYKHRNYEEAESFIKQLLRFINLKVPGNCLDLACGKGRHTKVLAASGHYCTGLDVSPNSIAAANAMHLSNARFFVHDMRDPIPAKDFDAVFNLFTSFGYFSSSEEDQKVLDNVYESLVPGGYFVQDYLNPLPVLPHLPKEETIEIDSVRFSIRKFMMGDFIKKEIAIDHAAHSFKRQFCESVKIIDAVKLQQMHIQSGFSVVNVFGNYQLEAFSEGVSPRIIIISRKHD